jgi:hypothetical protein
MRESLDGPVEALTQLKGLSFPVRKEDLVTHARMNRADPNVVTVFERLPDREYSGEEDVLKEYRKTA